jgi:hypothetical protein
VPWPAWNDAGGIGSVWYLPALDIDLTELVETAG